MHCPHTPSPPLSTLPSHTFPLTCPSHTALMHLSSLLSHHTLPPYTFPFRFPIRQCTHIPFPPTFCNALIHLPPYLSIPRCPHTPFLPPFSSHAAPIHFPILKCLHTLSLPLFPFCHMIPPACHHLLVKCSLVNFLGSVHAMSVMLRSLTGEDWYQIMWDAAVSCCSLCLSYLIADANFSAGHSFRFLHLIAKIKIVATFGCQSSISFPSPSLSRSSSSMCSSVCTLSSLILLPFKPYCVKTSSLSSTFPFFFSTSSFSPSSCIIGVLLENFSIFYNDDDTRLDRSTIKDFKHKWRLFNSDSDVSTILLQLSACSSVTTPLSPHPQDYIPANRLKLFLRSLDMQEFYTYNIAKGAKVL